MDLLPGKKIYFLSDFHLGAPDFAASLTREKRIVAFLENARKDAQEINQHEDRKTADTDFTDAAQDLFVTDRQNEIAKKPDS